MVGSGKKSKSGRVAVSLFPAVNAPTHDQVISSGYILTGNTLRASPISGAIIKAGKLTVRVHRSRYSSKRLRLTQRKVSFQSYCCLLATSKVQPIHTRTPVVALHTPLSLLISAAPWQMLSFFCSPSPDSSDFELLPVCK